MKQVVRIRFGNVLKLKEDKCAYDIDRNILERELLEEDYPISVKLSVEAVIAR